MQNERFQLRPSSSSKKPWCVEDTKADPAEDPVIYHFSSKKKAADFKCMMDSEHATPQEGV
ncbi:MULTISPECIES: hypothetical protein [Pseudomonas]|uniref:Uncharacterized protein n=2 Tax=Pseudomonas TaxID=286 RepID=A0A7X1GKC6_9PSED|nr:MULTISPECIES: hypothetical protein [Pseudomonas]MBC2693528.1 hypothetical protein [Pseudomonas kielensis]MDD1011103.1 hypothetical protein [Pseudomonas shahriarae]